MSRCRELVPEKLLAKNRDGGRWTCSLEEDHDGSHRAFTVHNRVEDIRYLRYEWDTVEEAREFLLQLDRDLSDA